MKNLASQITRINSVIMFCLAVPLIDTYSQQPGLQERDPKRTVNVTALQAGSNHYAKGNPGLEANFSLMASLAREASRSKPKPNLICFPEYSITGWDYPSE